MNPRQDTRQHILDTGSRIIAGKGFSSVGLMELLTAAGVPKGSFYHYFESKEQFGQALLADYFARYLGEIDALLASPGSGRARLMRYWLHWRGSQCAAACSEQKCLVVKLSAEVADLSEAMRITLRDGTEQVVARIAALIAAGVADGSLPPQTSAHGTAQMLYQMWLGASLLGKLRRDSAPLDQALAFTDALFPPTDHP